MLPHDEANYTMLVQLCILLSLSLSLSLKLDMKLVRVQKTVDKKKLEKASEMLAKKQERRELSGVKQQQNVNKYKSSEATASQVINKKDEDPNSNNNTKDIKLECFDISFGEKALIQGANITMAYGRR